MTTANDNHLSATPTLDTVLTVLVAALGPAHRWALEGWAAHLRPARHQVHAANSFARHEAEFGALRDAAHALTAARLLDFGVRPDEVRAFIEVRREARAAKASAA